MTLEELINVIKNLVCKKYDIIESNGHIESQKQVIVFGLLHNNKDLHLLDMDHNGFISSGKIKDYIFHIRSYPTRYTYPEHCIIDFRIEDHWFGYNVKNNTIGFKNENYQLSDFIKEIDYLVLSGKIPRINYNNL